MNNQEYKAILFDMDGTLVSMDQEEFMKEYFIQLVQVLKPYGLEDNALIKAVWAGTQAMILNNGDKKNEDVFWDKFLGLTKIDGSSVRARMDQFYVNEFNEIKKIVSPNPKVKEVIELARQKNRKVILATNQLFPRCAQLSRLAWIGLSEEDFDLITSYETDQYCKPNPKYFESICERIGVKPKDCLMIGNDEEEDRYSAISIGMDAYLVTDYMIEREELPWNGPRGNFESLLELLK